MDSLSTRHVLDDMSSRLGMKVEHELAPFEPEAGAHHEAFRHHHDKPATLRLWQLISPALPVGAYSYSGGLESVV